MRKVGLPAYSPFSSSSWEGKEGRSAVMFFFSFFQRLGRRER
jgi:hypothetical protein